MKVLENKKAFFDYHILEKIEAGIVLTGTEIKAIRRKKINIKNSYGIINKKEVFLEGFHISEFKEAGIFNHDPKRRKKLLLHKKEINSLIGKLYNKGITLIPLSFYFNKKNKIKVLLGIGIGKKKYDKRKLLAKKESDIQIERAIKEKNY